MSWLRSKDYLSSTFEATNWGKLRNSLISHFEKLPTRDDLCSSISTKCWDQGNIEISILNFIKIEVCLLDSSRPWLLRTTIAKKRPSAESRLVKMQQFSERAALRLRTRTSQRNFINCYWWLFFVHNWQCVARKVVFCCERPSKRQMKGEGLQSKEVAHLLFTQQTQDRFSTFPRKMIMRFIDSTA